MAQPNPIRPAPTAAQPNKRLQQTQAQVDEVVDIMRVNVDKVLERDQKLTELDNRADALQAGASQFEASAGKLKRKYWWKNMKMMLLLGFVIVIVIILIGVWISEWAPTGSTAPSTAGDKQSQQPAKPSSNATIAAGGAKATTSASGNSTSSSSQG